MLLAVDVHGCEEQSNPIARSRWAAGLRHNRCAKADLRAMSEMSKTFVHLVFDASGYDAA